MRSTGIRNILYCVVAYSVLLTFFMYSPQAASLDTRSGANVHWGLEKQGNTHWMITPRGNRFYSKGVNRIDADQRNRKETEDSAFHWAKYFTSMNQWRQSTKKQLVEWGFNTRGAWSDKSPVFGLPLMVELDLGRYAQLHWKDPFDPRMPKIVLERAKELVLPYRNNPWLVGYFSDNEVGWWNAPIFRWYLQQGWDNYTKRKLWQLLYDHYAGRWDLLAADWVPQGNLRSFTELKRSGAQLKLRPNGKGICVVNQFTYFYARRYYQLVGSAIRQAHPGALVLGDRLPLYYNQDAVRAMADQVDIISTNYNVDTRDGWVAPYYFNGLERLAGKPVLVSEFFFAADENRSGNRNERNGKPGHLMTVTTQSERARGVANALCNFARFPNIVGVHWFQYADEPSDGRDDGENYNMGLVDIDNRPYQKVIEVFKSLNPQMEKLHKLGEGKHDYSGMTKPTSIQSALNAISLTDNSLTDWEKETTRLPYFFTPAPYVPFADVHLAWRPEGLYLAVIASNYLDLDLITTENELPLTATFQTHVMVKDNKGAVHHYAIHLSPKRSRRFSYEGDRRVEITPQIVRYTADRSIERLQTFNHVQRLIKPLPHITFESFFPAKWLGKEVLRAGDRIRLNVIVINYLRELTMSLTHSSRLDALAKSNVFKTFILEDTKKIHRTSLAEEETSRITSFRKHSGLFQNGSHLPQDSL